MSTPVSPVSPAPESNRKFRVCIVGAGLAGSMMACMLGKLNYTVSVYEKREDPRVVRE